MNDDYAYFTYNNPLVYPNLQLCKVKHNYKKQEEERFVMFPFENDKEIIRVRNGGYEVTNKVGEQKKATHKIFVGENYENDVDVIFEEIPSVSLFKGNTMNDGYEYSPYRSEDHPNMQLCKVTHNYKQEEERFVMFPFENDKEIIRVRNGGYEVTNKVGEQKKATHIILVGKNYDNDVDVIFEEIPSVGGRRRSSKSSKKRPTARRRRSSKARKSRKSRKSRTTRRKY